MKKKNKVIVFLLCFFLFLPLSTVKAYVYHDCTWFAWQYTHDEWGITLPIWGYANNWYDYAARDGYPVDQTPTAKSIIVWDGHVAIVEQVSADGQSVYIKEGGYDSGIDGWYHEGWRDSQSSFCGMAFLGYIYLGDITPDTNITGYSDRPTNMDSETKRLLELERLRKQKADLQVQITKTEQEIADLDSEIADRQADNEERLRVMYMYSGPKDYLELLFSSKDVGECLENVATIKSIMKSDKKILEEMEDLQEELESKKVDLTGQYLELEKYEI